MKYLKLLGLVLTVFLNSNPLAAQDVNDDYFTVVYNDSTINLSTKQAGEKRVKTKKMSKEFSGKGEMRSRLGKFLVSYDDNYFMSEGVLHCLKMAIDSWENAISIDTPIEFHVCISEELSDDIAISTTVGYSVYNRRNFESLPDNLHRQSNSNIVVHDTVTINALLDWNSSWLYDDTYSGSINMSNAFMRSIAKIMGFGCSVICRTSGLGFAVNRFSSPFDKLLYNGTKYLADLKRTGNNADFEKFFSRPLYLKGASFTYPMYNQGHFVAGKSGVYFLLGYDNLMEVYLSDNNRLLKLNPETINVMKSIGWKPTPYDLQIVGDSIDALGYGSIYDHISFELLDSDRLPKTGDWTYQVYNPETKLYKDVCMSAKTSAFSVNPNILQKYQDEFMCTQGKVICEKDGVLYTTLTSLDNRPKIGTVKIENVKAVDEDTYQFDIYILAKGATGGYINVSDDTGASRNYDFQNGITHVEPMVKGYMVYIDISVSNAYGYSGKFIECPDIFNQPIYSKQNSEKERALTWVNGIRDTIVKDQDRINLSLPENYNSVMIDSVKWYAHFECTDNQEYTYYISDQLSPTFVCQPQMFNCYFSHAYPHYLKGFDWKRLKEVYPFGSYFSCYIYTTNKGKTSVASLRTEDITYDVLPQTPVLTLEKVWTPIEGDDDYPVAQIHVDSGNFDEGLILVEQSRDQLPVYVDTLFTTVSNDGFVVSLGTWNNGILCWVRNQYGQAVSEILRFDSSDIQNNILASDILTLDARRIVVKPQDEARLWVFDATGRLESNICTDKKVCIPLKPGIHLIKWLDTKSNIINKYKIYIK